MAIGSPFSKTRGGATYRRSRRFFTTLLPLVYRYLVFLGVDSNDLPDLLQETFAAVWHGAGSFRHESQVETWVIGIRCGSSGGTSRRTEG